jgi:hypothetical protein
MSTEEAMRAFYNMSIIRAGICLSGWPPFVYLSAYEFLFVRQSLLKSAVLYDATSHDEIMRLVTCDGIPAQLLPDQKSRKCQNKINY